MDKSLIDLIGRIDPRVFDLLGDLVDWTVPSKVGRSFGIQAGPHPEPWRERAVSAPGTPEAAGIGHQAGLAAVDLVWIADRLRLDHSWDLDWLCPPLKVPPIPRPPWPP